MTKDQLAAIMPTATPALLETYYQPILDQTTAAQINTPLRLAQFLAQVGNETGDMRITTENLNYSADGLIKTWPSLFNVSIAGVYAHKPQNIANRAYGNRMGNGDEASGDGWRYRGGGFIQLTGQGNYLAFEKDRGLAGLDADKVSGDPHLCVDTACWFWQKHGCDAFADKDDIVSLRRVVNGGLIGLAECQARLARAKQVLGITA